MIAGGREGADVTGSTDVAQTIERRLREVEAQLRGYEDLARERERLQRALHELRRDDGARPGWASTKPSAGKRPTAGRRRGGRRAGRGANVEAIIGFVTGNPGATAAEIASGTGIGRGVVYSATSRLAASGRLRRVAKGDRQVGYELGGGDAASAAAGPRAAAVPARDDSGSGATRETSARGDTPQVPVGASRAAGKRSRAARGTVAPTVAKRAATGERAAAGGQTGARGGGRRRSAAVRGRAPRGANRAAVLGVIGERPGVSARELAAASGVGRGALYALLRTLTERGEIATQQLPSGHTGYTRATPPPAAPSPAPSTPPDTRPDSAATPAPAASRRQHDTNASPTSGDEVTADEARSGETSPQAATDSQ
jgi:hypothetical protein